MDNVMKHATEIDHFAQHTENQRLFSNKMINNENRANRFPNKQWISRWSNTFT